MGKVGNTLRKHPWLQRSGQWVFLFLVLLLAIWGTTQQRNAPQLVLLLFLYIITINFSLPAERSLTGLVPAVALANLLISGLPTAVALFLAGFTLTELIRPLWNPLWENVNREQPTRRQRLGLLLRDLLALAATGRLMLPIDDLRLLLPNSPSGLLLLGRLMAIHGSIYLIGSLILWRLTQRQPLGQPTLAIFGRESSLGVIAAGFLTAPLAILGSLTFVQLGVPAFVIYCLSLMFISLLTWVAWQRQFILEQQVAQFAALNAVGTSLRETLELPTVLSRTFQQVAGLIPADQFIIALIDEAGRWQQPLVASIPTELAAAAVQLNHLLVPDDFTRWVGERSRVLDLNSDNMHFASRHGLLIPTPKPVAWLGVPLITADRTIGVMVLQRLWGGPRFSRWSRELFVAIAGQASAAIQNARLYSETLRLYNLTDEALAQRIRQLRSLLDSIQEGVLMLDRHGQIALVNPIAAHLLNQTPDALQGQPLPQATAVALGYQPALLNQLLENLATNQIPSQPTSTLYQIHQLGSSHTRGQRFMQRSEAPVVAVDGQLIGWLMLFRDVTEEQELAERRTDLARMIVHDLRNPITSIISNISLATNRLLPSASLDEATELLHDARQACHDMLDMVDSLMDLNRMEAGQQVVDPEAMNLVRLAEGVNGRLQSLAQRQGIDLRLEYEPTVPLVWGDEEMIRRVLVNLLDNALKFTPDGGRVLCRIVTEPPSTPDYEPGARCIIADSGPGIPTHLRELIFDRYMRTNQGGAQVRGTGLGLTFCKLVVEAHNGRIWVEAEPIAGSRFIFTLPGIPIFANE